MQSLRRLSSLRNAAAVPRLLARAAPPLQPTRCCRLSTGAPSRPPPPQTPKDTSKMRVSSGSLGYEANARPDAETVKRLGENAKMQGVVWQMWVPEAGIRFGDRCVRLPPSIALPSRALPRGKLSAAAFPTLSLIPTACSVAGSFGSCWPSWARCTRSTRTETSRGRSSQTCLRVRSGAFREASC